MTTLVTCGTGFVSRAFVRALEDEGERVHVLIRDGSKASLFPKEKVFGGDLFDPFCVKRAVEGVDTVVHVPPRVYPVGDMRSDLTMHRRVHVESTRLMLEASIAEGVAKFLFISSAHATGRDPNRVLCESAGRKPETSYARAKLEAEELILSYAERHSLKAVILRPPSIYGPGDKSVVSSLCRAAQRGLWLPLKGLSAYHSLVFVDNLVRAGLALLKATRGSTGSHVFIVKDREDYRPEDLYAAVCRALGKGIRLFRAPLPLLRVLGFIGVRLRNIPGLGGLALFRQLMIPQRYCRHLFDETVPGFPFVSFEEAIQRIFASSVGARSLTIP